MFWFLYYFFAYPTNCFRYTKNILATSTLTSTNLPKLSRPLFSKIRFFFSYYYFSFFPIRLPIRYLSIKVEIYRSHFRYLGNGYLIVGELDYRVLSWVFYELEKYEIFLPKGIKTALVCRAYHACCFLLLLYKLSCFLAKKFNDTNTLAPTWINRWQADIASRRGMLANTNGYPRPRLHILNIFEML